VRRLEAQIAARKQADVDKIKAAGRWFRALYEASYPANWPKVKPKENKL
jgi:hypothetical protein